MDMAALTVLSGGSEAPRFAERFCPAAIIEGTTVNGSKLTFEIQNWFSGFDTCEFAHVTPALAEATVVRDVGAPRKLAQGAGSIY